MGVAMAAHGAAGQPGQPPRTPQRDSDAVGVNKSDTPPAKSSGSGADRMTAHGAERIAGAGATRGGVLSLEEIAAVREHGRVMTQAGGGTVRIFEQGGRFNVVVEGERGIITTFRNLSQKSLDGLAKNYGWKSE